MRCSILDADYHRYDKKAHMPKFQKYYRKALNCKTRCAKWWVYNILFRIDSKRYGIDMSIFQKIGPGLYFGHPFAITINPKAIIGKNINIHKGVTIGQENRGSRQGVPVIGDDVWIGINAAIVGKIRIGNDVLIAPNSFVNFDVPDHSVVFGNPGIIKKKEFATDGYINRRIE